MTRKHLLGCQRGEGFVQLLLDSGMFWLDTALKKKLFGLFNPVSIQK